jgi:hypothetical protein
LDWTPRRRAGRAVGGKQPGAFVAGSTTAFLQDPRASSGGGCFAWVVCSPSTTVWVEPTAQKPELQQGKQLASELVAKKKQEQQQHLHERMSESVSPKDENRHQNGPQQLQAQLQHAPRVQQVQPQVQVQVPPHQPQGQMQPQPQHAPQQQQHAQHAHHLAQQRAALNPTPPGYFSQPFPMMGSVMVHLPTQMSAQPQIPGAKAGHQEIPLPPQGGVHMYQSSPIMLGPQMYVQHPQGRGAGAVPYRPPYPMGAASMMMPMAGVDGIVGMMPAIHKPQLAQIMGQHEASMSEDERRKLNQRRRKALSRKRMRDQDPEGYREKEARARRERRQRQRNKQESLSPNLGVEDMVQNEALLTPGALTAHSMRLPAQDHLRVMEEDGTSTSSGSNTAGDSSASISGGGDTSASNGEESAKKNMVSMVTIKRKELPRPLQSMKHHHSKENPASSSYGGSTSGESRTAESSMEDSNSRSNSSNEERNSRSNSSNSDDGGDSGSGSRDNDTSDSQEEEETKRAKRKRQQQQAQVHAHVLEEAAAKCQMTVMTAAGTGAPEQLEHHLPLLLPPPQQQQ